MSPLLSEVRIYIDDKIQMIPRTMAPITANFLPRQIPYPKKKYRITGINHKNGIGTTVDLPNGIFKILNILSNEFLT